MVPIRGGGGATRRLLLAAGDEAAFAVDGGLPRGLQTNAIHFISGTLENFTDLPRQMSSKILLCR